VQYTKNIPAIYMDPEAYPRLLSSAERKEKNKKMEPPHLPPHLSHVLLHKTLLHPDKIKKHKHERTEVPSHVILNHLATTSIKSDVLAVACINRYYGKFVNSIMYSPI
ncbi:hypothetical protein BABINDRAFT_20833, partial [Babjeviella inositovora NRRL Y-12698]